MLGCGMSPETAKQVDMFPGEAVDTRTPRQKKLDKHALLPIQTPMFPGQGDLIQIGGTVRPKMEWDGDTTVETLRLQLEDTRTDEEIERERIRAEQSLIVPMFPDEMGAADGEPTDGEAEDDEAAIEPLSLEERITAATEELYAICLDMSQTVAATPDVLKSQAVCLAIATLQAQSAGVDPATITKFLTMAGQSQPQTINTTHHTPSSAGPRRRRATTNHASHYPTSRMHLRNRLARLAGNH